MPNFILIEQELKVLGGHNFQYALDMLGAAEEMGFSPVLAVNRCFEPPKSWPSSWRLLGVFDAEATVRHCAGDSRSRYPMNIEGEWLDREEIPSMEWWLDYRVRRDRLWRIKDMADGCALIFEQIGFQPEDRVFFSTINDFDLLGLANFLGAHPESKSLDWHLQFHFDIFNGREPDYDSQVVQRTRLRRQVDEVMRVIRQHQVHWYATTEKVARQYKRIGHADYQPLPYPINKRFLERHQEDASSEESAPSDQYEAPHRLRVALAGSMRREKGRRELAQLVDDLGSRFLEPGRIQIWLQTTKRNVRRLVSSQWRQGLEIQPSVDCSPDGPIVAIQHPLSPEDYARFVCEADVGLFPYDSLRYHARCSGVLVEMLTVGLPVIVPGACWLADQILRPTNQYLEDLAQSSYVVSRDEHGTLTFSRDSNEELDLAVRGDQTSNVLVTFRQEEANPPGHEVQVDCHEYDANGKTVRSPWVSIVGRANDGTSAVNFTLAPDTRSIKLRFTNPFATSELTIARVQTAILRPPEHAEYHPRFAVGMISVNHQQIPHLLDELIQHYGHYHTTAREYSKTWSYEHAPHRTIEIIDANTTSVHRKAA